MTMPFGTESPDVPRSAVVPTILVTDCGRDLADVLVHRLRTDGCLVLQAHNSVEALEIVRIHSRPIDLMVSSSGNDGRRLATVLNHFRSRMKILYVREYDES